MGAGACCLPSCAREWFGRLLAGAVQNDARDRSNNWDDLVQLPRNLPYNCVAYWCRCSLQFHQPFPMFDQKIIQEGRELWSNPLLKAESPLRSEQRAWDLLHLTSETLLRVEISQPVRATCPSAWPLTVNVFVLASKQIESTSHWYASYWFFRMSLSRQLILANYCLDFAACRHRCELLQLRVSSVKWHKGMGNACALSAAQQRGETQEA